MKCPKAKQRRGRHSVVNNYDGYTYICTCGCHFECWSDNNYYILNEHEDENEDVELMYVQRVCNEPGTAETFGNIVFLCVGIISMAMIGALAVKLLMLP